MPSRSMVTLAEAHARASKKVAAEQRNWAAVGGENAVLEIILYPPTERQALTDQSQAIAWVQEWRKVDALPGVSMMWVDRQWSRLGAQSVPDRCIIRGADAIASFAGAAANREWIVLRDRANALRAAFAGRVDSVNLLSGPIRTHARAIQMLIASDFVTLLHVVDWLMDNPASGWRVRQLPIRGIDTKWVENHRTVVEGLFAALSGKSSLGLLATPALVRVRFLDSNLRPGGLCDVIAPIGELAKLSVAPRIVFVFENLETMFAMPELAGCVVVHGGGYAAPRLAEIPWIQSGRIMYWGDLDSDGFAILHALRLSCESVTSVLMDEHTLESHADLWVAEKQAARGTYSTLTAAEQQTLERIRGEGNVRLEQERIGWGYALAELAAVAQSAVTK